jgi:hypothetical protein
MAHVNRSFARSFSLNIFRRNAQELLAATHSVRDADQGLELMAQDNREAGQQAHREVNRFVHNFVTAARTIVEHTRNLVREHYADTTFQKDYKDMVGLTFASEPVAKFVQDLRNYMVHKGLPDSQMYLEFKSADKSAEGESTLKTGVRYQAATLLEWDGWTLPARTYIEAAGEYVYIHAFAEEYVEKVLKFHSWLDNALNQFHEDDLVKLSNLQAEYARLSNERARPASQAGAETVEAAPPASGGSPPAEQQFEFSDPISSQINEVGKTILEKIRRLDFGARTSETFPSERPVGATITDDQILETPILRGNDRDGRPVIAFISSGGELFGLDLNVFATLQPLVEKILEVGWARNALSRQFIEQTAIKWLRSSFHEKQSMDFANALCSASREEVEMRDFWAPIACLEVEEKFSFGPVEIAPIARAMIDQLETTGVNSASKQRDDVAMLFKSLRLKMQGLAAVVVHMEAEQARVCEEGMAIAENAVGLLRFFSPISRTPWQVCSTALLGTEILPHLQALVLGKHDFLFSDGSVFQPFVWRISKENISELWRAGLAKASGLISVDGLSQFQLAVRGSLLLFSTSTTFRHVGDRLVYALSSVEGILLRHSIEPTEFSVEERMSLLLTNDNAERERIARNVRDAYRFRRRHGVSVLSPHDQQSLAMFLHNVHVVLCIALENSNAFASKADFIDAIDRRKTIDAIDQA